MKTTWLGMALATLASGAAGGAAGCAHGLTADGALQDRHGALRVASETRLLLAGPASSVHTRLDARKPAWLFVVGAVTGDDRDCVLATVRETPVAVEAGWPVQLAPGRELCVAVAGTTEVLWHARVDAKAIPRPATAKTAKTAKTETTATTAASPGAVALQ